MYSKHTRQLFLPDCSLLREKQFTVSVDAVIVMSAYTTATLTLCLCQQSCDTFPLKTNDLKKDVFPTAVFSTTIPYSL